MNKTLSRTNKSIYALIGELKSAVLSAQTSINDRFAALKSEAEKLKEVEPSIVFPWDTYTPPADQRRYQVENCLDAVLKVLPTRESGAIRMGEVIKRINALHLSYSENSIRCAVSSLTRGYVGNGYILSRKESIKRENGQTMGRPGLLLWKTKM